MIFRAIDSSGDWQFGRGVYSYLTENDAISANIKTRLLSWKGDCFFALDDFVDWLGRLDKGQQQNLADELQFVILGSYGVVGINSFSWNLDHETRRFSATYDISTIFSRSFQDSLDLATGSGGS